MARYRHSMVSKVCVSWPNLHPSKLVPKLPGCYWLLLALTVTIPCICEFLCSIYVSTFCTSINLSIHSIPAVFSCLTVNCFESYHRIPCHSPSCYSLLPTLGILDRTCKRSPLLSSPYVRYMTACSQLDASDVQLTIICQAPSTKFTKKFTFVEWSVPAEPYTAWISANCRNWLTFEQCMASLMNPPHLRTVEL